MSINRNGLGFAVGVLLVAQVVAAQTQPAPAPAPAATATTTTMTTMRSGVVVYASGNTLITKESDGVTREHTVPDGFTFQMGGKSVTLADLKPGDKITATITETKTVEPVTVTRVVNGTVMESSMDSILVKNAKGQLVKYSNKDVQGRDVKIIQDGKEVAIKDLRVGTKLNATIITRYPPQVSSTRAVSAKVTSPPPPAAPATEPAPVVAAAEPAPRTLPKTGSPLPLFALVGGALVLAAASLRLSRRSRIAR